MLLTLLMLSGVAHASPQSYDLNVELRVNGERVTSPVLRVREGELAEVGAGPGNFVEVLAGEGSAQGHHGIYMEFLVGTRTEGGRRVIVSRPRILVNENEPATITVGDGGVGTVALSVTARRRELFSRMFTRSSR